MKYSRYLPEEGRRETYDEIVTRNKNMHIKRWPKFKKLIDKLYEPVYNKQVLPSMRSMQFAGYPIERNPSRIYNCAYLPMSEVDGFSELMFLLLGGTGVGYSVQFRHVNKLPIVVGPKRRTRRYKVGDSIEGWADAVKVLMESYFHGKMAIRFDYSDVRPKGAELVVTGGKAPGPEPLRICIEKIRAILNNCVGRSISPLECHDINCFIADAVLVGGIRRAAMIALFSHNDWEMMTCKQGKWYEFNAQRGRANNSVILKRDETTKEQFDQIWKAVQASNAGEPGVYWTNNLDWGTNPCAEIALRPYQFCNLVEINGSDVDGQEDFNNRVTSATGIATLQAAYTDFHYLRNCWKTTTEQDALIGVGITGIASRRLNKIDLEEANDIVRNVNVTWSDNLGINPAARRTTIKPSGTSSIVLGSSSGIHPWHNNYYLRRMRVNKDEAIYQYLKAKLPELVEDDYTNPENSAMLVIPQKAPERSIYRSESAMSLFQRVLHYNEKWVRPGTLYGDNHNNVSATLSLQPNDWKIIGEMMWKHKDDYNGISVLPYDGGSYVQAPFEDCTKNKYDKLSQYLTEIDLTEVKENADYTDLTGEVACAGGSCDITF